MKLSFSLKGKRQTDSHHAVVKAGMPEVQWRLYTALLSAFLDESCYQPAGDKLSSLREKVRDNDPAFVAKLAVYLREKMNLRPLSYIVTAELAALHGDSEWVGSLIARVLQQAGEIPEWMDYYIRANGGAASLSRAGVSVARPGRPGTLRLGVVKPGRAVLKGLAAVCNRLDEYQFTRYTREEQLKLKKSLSLIRPKAKDKVQRILFRKIGKDRLPA